MEHRWHTRSTPTLNVDVRFGGECLPDCCAVNMSVEGMFLETKGVRLPKGCVAELIFEVVQDEVPVMQVIPALVVHTSPQGAGFLLATPNPACRAGADNLEEAA